MISPEIVINFLLLKRRYLAHDKNLEFNQLLTSKLNDSRFNNFIEFPAYGLIKRIHACGLFLFISTGIHLIPLITLVSHKITVKQHQQ